ncbi:tRNA uridine-5-carboxymethylaminomethyl(34) synthesis GTPase MnmE [SAR86 cluster bacterium]|nr:tRNA uridine-5-carboxymethylaminomethyl(34) synthesis GTPase MnmE [SAR86 cluster bacterium]
MIFALATPAGKAALAVFRISGSGCHEVISKILDKNIAEFNRVFLRKIIHDGVLVDVSTVVFYKSPKSYTGEDMVEVFCHGGFATLKKLIDLFHNLNIREAEPGEFTKISVLNGKQTLNEAESLLDLINSTTDAEMNMALGVVAGELSNTVSVLGDELDDIRVFVESIIDFDDEDGVDVSLEEVIERLEALRLGFGDLKKQGFRSSNIGKTNGVLMLGPPNVGKSSLFNCLLGQNKAIVSPNPGTTRDMLEGQVLMHKTTFNLVDAAGIRDSSVSEESMGVNKVLNDIDSFPLVLVVCDQEYKTQLKDLRGMIDNKKSLVVKNKSDLCNKQEDGMCLVSAKTGDGIPELKKMISGFFVNSEPSVDQRFILNDRQLELIDGVIKSLEACQGLHYLESIELIAENLKSARNHLNDFLGERSSDELLGEIFSKFCIGK